MSFICKTCGGMGGKHKRSQLDPEGVGHPDHKLIQGTGFYSPMDIAPGEYPSPQHSEPIDVAKGLAEYKRDWINKHDKADEILSDVNNRLPVAAIYYYPPTHHDAEQKHIWKAIAARMAVEELEAYDE